MCAKALWTVFPCGSSTAFFGVMIILAFMPNTIANQLWGKPGAEARNFREAGAGTSRPRVQFTAKDAGTSRPRPAPWSVVRVLVIRSRRNARFDSHMHVRSALGLGRRTARAIPNNLVVVSRFARRSLARE